MPARASLVFKRPQDYRCVGTGKVRLVDSPDIVRGKAPAGTISATGTVFDTIFLGASTRVVVDLDAGKRVAVLEQNDLSRTPSHRGDKVTVAIHPQFLSPLS